MLRNTASISRRVVWLQLLIGWLPVWVLMTSLMVVMHSVPVHRAMFAGLRLIIAAAALGFFVQRFCERHPWPGRMTLPFVAMHSVGAVLYAVTLFALNSALASIFHGAIVVVLGPGLGASITSGVWLYVMIAGVAYTTQTSERAARAEAAAARAQLSALRSQINPHFLFNALHTVVQLIPREPKQAAQAAEQLAGLLRTAIEEDRDVVSVAEELGFVGKYLEIEHIRFGDRLRVTIDVSDAARAAAIPSFAAQTLVENAVRHGAAPRVEPTAIAITGSVANGTLTLTVADTGAGATDAQMSNGTGTGLRRLRERLNVLYDGRARLDLVSNGKGTTATLSIPQDSGE